MPALRMTQRRTMLQKARGQVEQRIQKAAEASLGRRFASLKRDLRRSNLRKRLKGWGMTVRTESMTPAHQEETLQRLAVALHWKADGVNPLKGPNNDWQPWIDEFTSELAEAMQGGVDDLFESENVFWTSRGQAPAPWDAARTVEQYQTRVGRKIKDIGDDTLRDTQQAIADWYGTDQTLPELIATLSQWYGPVRAEMIAITEATGLAAQVGGEMMAHFGIAKWRWDAFADACADCLELNGQTFAAEDTDSYPPAHPRCRCGQFFLIENDESLKFMPAILKSR